jgi:hypothetical protein
LGMIGVRREREREREREMLDKQFGGAERNMEER